MPHKLLLYRHAVQDPYADLALALRIHAHGRGKRVPAPRFLREDFAGTCAIAIAFVASDADRQAVAIDRDASVLRWAWKQAQRELGPRSADLHLLRADVRKVVAPRDVPRVDILISMNFGMLYFHQRAEFLAYLRRARQALRPHGVLVFDIYGGPGAMQSSIQTRRVVAAPEVGLPTVQYIWEQRRFDAATHRTDCRIHFQFRDGSRRDNAFRYDWRLWTPPELLELLVDAGFAKAEVWCDKLDPRRGVADGRFRPVQSLPDRRDFIACVVGRR